MAVHKAEEHVRLHRQTDTGSEEMSADELSLGPNTVILSKSPPLVISG